MSQINIKSISGITSITTPAGVDNQLTVHTNDTTEKLKVTSDGVNVTGVVTATSFVGALPITGDTNNRVITATGSGGLNGEANLTFSGSVLGLHQPSVDTNYVLDANGGAIFTKSGTYTSNDFNKGHLTLRNTTASQGAFLDFRASSSSGTYGVIAKIGGFNTKTGSGYDGALTFSTRQNSTNTMVERVRIDSSGRVLIGGTSNSASSHADELQIINTSAEGGISIINGDSSMGHIYFGDTSGTAQGRIDYNHGGNYMRFYTADNERLRITAAGNVGINDNNPANHLIVKAPGGSGHTTAKVTSGDASTSMVMQVIQGSEGRLGMATNHPLAIYAGALERLRIDSSGRLLIGTTSRGQDDGDNLTIDGSGEGTGRTGLTIRSATNTFGSIFFSDATSGAAQYDGVVAYDHSTQTMRFSTASTQRLFIESDGTVRFDPNAGGTLKIGGSSAHTSKIVIADNVGNSNGNLLVEGGDGSDFFTIQSNGNVNFASGNGITFADSSTSAVLDDYETGTWTCTVYYATGSTTGSHTNTTTTTGYFEKIGNLVFIGLNFYPVNYNSGNTAIITKFSLPYNPVQRTALAFYRYSGAGNYGQMLPQSSQDDSGCYLDTAGHGLVLVGGTNQGSGYWGHHTGQVNAHGHVSGCYRVS